MGASPPGTEGFLLIRITFSEAMSWKQANWRTLVIEYRPMKAASASKLDEVIRMHIGKIAKEKSEFKKRMHQIYMWQCLLWRDFRHYEHVSRHGLKSMREFRDHLARLYLGM